MAYANWLLKFLQGALVLVLGPLSGVAISLSAWVTPAILHPENRSRSEIAQFSETVERGMKYLQPSSRLAGSLLMLVAFLTSQHPDPSIAWKWKLYAAALVITIQVAWYETYFIFPINDTIKGMGRKLEGTTDQELPEPEQKRLQELLLTWEFRHRVRIAVPFCACVIAVVAVLI